MENVKNSFQKTERRLALMKSLDVLKSNLQNLGPIPNDKDLYDYAIRFFNTIVSFQDNNVQDNNVKDSKFLKKSTASVVQTLAKHINNAGRRRLGWVRAQPGETVTLDNLYLGIDYPLFKKTAAFWKEQPEKDAQRNRIEDQLVAFIISHRKPMIRLINKVLNKNEEKPNKFIIWLKYQIVRIKG